MASARNWESRIGRRVRLRDLHVLFAVVQHGSMAKAGGHLGMSQSAVSQAIAALEQALEVPLLDRTPRGVELTLYGSALMRRGQAAFDELRLGIKDIEFLTDPEVGEVRIACTETIAAGVLPAAIERFSLRYPRVKLQVSQTTTHLTGFEALHERRADLVFTLLPKPFEGDLTEHLQTEILFHDRICLAAAIRSPWARRRKIDFADVAEAELISPASDTPGGAALIEAFRAAGLAGQQVSVTTFSVHLRSILSMRGRFIAVLPVSILRFNPGLYSLKELPLELPMPPLPALIVTVKNRTLSPPVERFIECARDVAKGMPAPSPRSRWSEVAIDIKSEATVSYPRPRARRR
jgi:DNA-binding transcriptional LysR family regulator